MRRAGRLINVIRSSLSLPLFLHRKCEARRRRRRRSYRRGQSPTDKTGNPARVPISAGASPTLFARKCRFPPSPRFSFSSRPATGFPMSLGIYLLVRVPTFPLSATRTWSAERRFSSPEGEFPHLVGASVSFSLSFPPFLPRPSVISGKNFRTTVARGGRARSHFFYLFILICGCLKPYSPFFGFFLAAGWLFLTSLWSSFVLTLLFSRSDSSLRRLIPFSLTELHAQCKPVAPAFRPFLCSALFRVPRS